MAEHETHGHTVDALSALVTLLTVVATLGGLMRDGVYAGPAATAEMLRGYDLVTLVLAVPALAWSAWSARHGSLQAVLVRASMLAYLTYTYAYYVFGTGFNDLFLLHIAVFAAALTGLVLALVHLDVSAVADAFHPRTRVRTVGVLLGVLAVALGGMWIFASVDQAVNGGVPPGSALVESDTIVHLGIALDLALLVPLYSAAAVLVWRRTGWGFVLATISVVAGVLHQVSYLVAMPFQVAADVPGAVAADPFEPIIVAFYVVAAALLLQGALTARRRFLPG